MRRCVATWMLLGCAAACSCVDQSHETTMTAAMSPETPSARASGGPAPNQSAVLAHPDPATSSSESGGAAPMNGSGGAAPMNGSGGVASMNGAGGVASMKEPERGGASANSNPDGEGRVHFVGRFEKVATGARFAWSGSGVVARFEGRSVAVKLQDGGSNQFTVVLDGQVAPVLRAESGEKEYPLATGLEPGVHRVELYRRTEASFGPSTFISFDFGPDGKLLPPADLPAKRLEIIGDSISCGYGNEGTSPTCSFSADTENHYLTYGAIAARALKAELTTIAWSGKGIVYNYDKDTTDPLPALYDRTIPTDANSKWDFSLQSDAVVINLGTNDFSTDGDPEPDLFTTRYQQLLERVRQAYPKAFILCTVGNLLGGDDLAAARAGIARAVSQRNLAGDSNVEHWEMNIPNANPGCDYHPGLATHQAIAEALVSELSKRAGL